MSLHSLLAPRVGSLAALLAPVSRASGPTFWTTATAADFLKGTSDGVYVSLSGVVTAGPQLTNRLTSTPAQVWSLADAADGALWAGTGADGRVLRLRPRPAGANRVRFGREQCLRARRVRLARVCRDGTRRQGVCDRGRRHARTFFDPEEKYIWALHATRAAGSGWARAIRQSSTAWMPNGLASGLSSPGGTCGDARDADPAGRMLAGHRIAWTAVPVGRERPALCVLDSGLTELQRRHDRPERRALRGRRGARRRERAASETTSVAVTLAARTASHRQSSVRRQDHGHAEPAPSRPIASLYARRIEPNGTWEAVWNSPDVIYDIAATIRRRARRHGTGRPALQSRRATAMCPC